MLPYQYNDYVTALVIGIRPCNCTLEERGKNRKRENVFHMLLFWLFIARRI